MREFPKSISFKYPWRKYQQRVLDELEEHLSDGHLHIIAPPGSGKTVLGLEVVLRLNQPTLILSPTLTIRNQWVERFCELFLQTDTKPDWISTDVKHPKFMTVATYQGLHTACSDWDAEEEEFEEEEISKETDKISSSKLQKVIKSLKSLGIKTIVVDEAHHLKNSWWQTLIEVKNQLSATVVGLTATPPYDVTGLEWSRYIELNGAIDAEITVPELVVEGNLCPHQDYVYFTSPTLQEQQNILEYRKNIRVLLQDIYKDTTLLEAIQQLPFWENPTENLEWIFSNIEYYSACLVFLNAHQIEISEAHLEIIGNKNVAIPILDAEWMHTLLDFYLFKGKSCFIAYEEHREKLEHRLKRVGAIERQQIDFVHNQKISNSLISNISKLKGIQEIVDFEYQQLGKNFRMVVLTDYIRKEYYVSSTQNTLELRKIGVLPIFEKLRRENTHSLKLGILTGSLVVIPKSAWTSLKEKIGKLSDLLIDVRSVPYDDNYLEVRVNTAARNKIVNLITQIFEEGEIEVLIGTKSLLGEGWDAPTINSLVLASFVGSFVSSNQMRGRAIRSQTDNPDKTAHIWHLACVDSTLPSGGDDVDLLRRRFKTFVGISENEKDSIENGIQRLIFPKNFQDREGALSEK